MCVCVCVLCLCVCVCVCVVCVCVCVCLCVCVCCVCVCPPLNDSRVSFCFCLSHFLLILRARGWRSNDACVPGLCVFTLAYHHPWYRRWRPGVALKFILFTNQTNKSDTLDIAERFFSGTMNTDLGTSIINCNYLNSRIGNPVTYRNLKLAQLVTSWL